MLTRITELRKLTKNNISSDFDTMIEHLKTIQNEKKDEEAALIKVVEEKEKARVQAVLVLKEGGLQIPSELASEITLESYLKKPARRGRRRKVDLGNQPKSPKEMKQLLGKENNTEAKAEDKK